jgi:GH24 family phage-related lysozyme (muramidase)
MATFDLKEQLKRQEGFSPIPYQDADGWSIGYGHWRKNKADLPSWVDETEADELLEQEIEEVEIWLMREFPEWTGKLTDNRRKVVVNIVFNVGYAGFAPPGKAFYRLIAAINENDWEKAGDEIIDSHLAPARAKELARIMGEG